MWTIGAVAEATAAGFVAEVTAAGSCQVPNSSFQVPGSEAQGQLQASRFQVSGQSPSESRQECQNKHRRTHFPRKCHRQLLTESGSKVCGTCPSRHGRGSHGRRARARARAGARARVRPEPGQSQTRARSRARAGRKSVNNVAHRERKRKRKRKSHGRTVKIRLAALIS